MIVAKGTGLVIGSLIYYNWHLLNANSLFTENCIKLKGSCLSLAFSRQTLRPCCCPLHTHTQSHIISHAHTLGHGLFVLSGEEVVRACRLVFIAVLSLVCHTKPCTVMLQMSCVETQVHTAPNGCPFQSLMFWQLRYFLHLIMVSCETEVVVFCVRVSDWKVCSRIEKWYSTVS